ncbi:prevent-host-death family protein [Marinomonas rhizomae]|uniref:Antitoxin n=1 Tax=Marinomonas rhizomae TaxID=491948 RepID=A0A366IXA2_9GAMM|nr:prevent-host-death family protein [Marinomonas rhizomae]
MRTEVVTTLKRQATKLLADLRESKEPILITEHVQPSAYLLDVADYELMV